MMDMRRYEFQNTRSGRESTQDHPIMSQHAWNCLELNGIARGCLELFFSASGYSDHEIREADHVLEPALQGLGAPPGIVANPKSA